MGCMAFWGVSTIAEGVGERICFVLVSQLPGLESGSWWWCSAGQRALPSILLDVTLSRRPPNSSVSLQGPSHAAHLPWLRVGHEDQLWGEEGLCAPCWYFLYSNALILSKQLRACSFVLGTKSWIFSDYTTDLGQKQNGICMI